MTILINIIVSSCFYFVIKVIGLQMQPNNSLKINHLTIVHHELVVKLVSRLK